MTVHATILATLASIAFLWVYLFWLYGDFRVDQFRQQMFIIRDELFDDALEGRVSFDDDAYGVTRVTANGFIRYAHLLSISHLIAAKFWAMKHSDVLPKITNNFKESLADMPAEKRDRYLSYRNRINRTVMKHLVLNSPFLFLTIAIPASAYFVAAFFIDRAIATFTTHLEKMDEIAYAAATPIED